ncbi:1-deoxy-D-xylulose-5-phosphate reductoisomerase [Larkinella sp. VNQ87]|uniref:1-deoxy-D-xylulose-5-phosphate reductoisomerase n=1 Tax=Larkinella sp. VNQ87 TaxID=3400921 RepID=UPI003C0AA836
MTNSKRHIAILGSTGSIGTQAIDVVRAHPDVFEVEVLVANNNAELLIEQAALVRPNVVVVCNEDRYDAVFAALDPLGIKVYAGAKAVASVVQMERIDIVLTAMVGYAGLLPTIKAIEAGKHIALANKETLVVAGELITKLAREKGVSILPVDSEHSAIFQCLAGEFHNPIEKIILTASGGPFRGKSREFLKTVTKAQALKHPNWSMGAKITIDSATLMNKGLEVIEAKWLFSLEPAQIEVIVHPQSIIHSMVQFRDGSLKAQMGLPDMRLPIQYALAYPNRLSADFPRFDFANYPSLTFEPADRETFRNLQLAFDALERGGNVPCIINAANEVAVAAFLQDEIGFLEISEIIEEATQKVSFVTQPTYEDYVQTDEEARRIATARIKSFV